MDKFELINLIKDIEKSPYCYKEGSLTMINLVKRILEINDILSNLIIGII